MPRILSDPCHRRLHERTARGRGPGGREPLGSGRHLQRQQLRADSGPFAHLRDALRARPARPHLPDVLRHELGGRLHRRAEPARARGDPHRGAQQGLSLSAGSHEPSGRLDPGHRPQALRARERRHDSRPARPDAPRRHARHVDGARRGHLPGCEALQGDQVRMGLLRPSGNGLLELRRRFHPRRHPILRHLPEHSREPTRELRVDELARAQRGGRGAERPQHPRQERTGRRGGPRSARGGRMVNRWRRVVGLGGPGWRRLGPRRLHRLWRRRRAPALVRVAGAERRAAPVEPALLRLHRSWQLHPPREVRPRHDEADRGRRVRTRRGLGRRRDGEERAHRADR